MHGAIRNVRITKHRVLQWANCYVYILKVCGRDGCSVPTFGLVLSAISLLRPRFYRFCRSCTLIYFSQFALHLVLCIIFLQLILLINFVLINNSEVVTHSIWILFLCHFLALVYHRLATSRTLAAFCVVTLYILFNTLYLI